MIDVQNTNFHNSEVGRLPEQVTVRTVIERPVIPCYSNWKYPMRRNMQEIIPGVFLGPHSAASTSHLDNLINNGITHIICVRQDIEANFIRPHFLDKFKYLTLDIADSVNESIIPHFTKVKEFIEECLVLGGKVLIHGSSGISRSAALVLAFIMEKYKMSFREAYTLVKERRYCIEPNIGFIAQLEEFEPIYKAQQTLQQGQSSTNNNITKKRKAEQLDVEFEMLPLPPPPSPVFDNCPNCPIVPPPSPVNIDLDFMDMSYT